MAVFTFEQKSQIERLQERNASPEDIMSWNAIGEDLSIGQKLKIKTLN